MLRDYDAFLQDPYIARGLKSLARDLQGELGEYRYEGRICVQYL